jgi:hypothetical protein
MAGLGFPESELLQEADVARVVYRKLAFYYEGIRQSDQNLMTNVTDEFTLASGSRTQDISSLTTSAIITPLWCERKIYNGTNDVWEFVPTVNLDSVEERRFDGRIAVAYYGTTANQITAIFSAAGDESPSPRNTFRIWYSPANTFTANKDATIAIPDTLAALVAVDAQLNCIPILTVNCAKYMDKRPELGARVEAWQSMAGALQSEKQEWNALYEKWIRRSRGSHRAVNHSDVLGLDTSGGF